MGVGRSQIRTRTLVLQDLEHLPDSSRRGRGRATLPSHGEALAISEQRLEPYRPSWEYPLLMASHREGGGPIGESSPSLSLSPYIYFFLCTHSVIQPWRNKWIPCTVGSEKTGKTLWSRKKHCTMLSTPTQRAGEGTRTKMFLEKLPFHLLLTNHHQNSHAKISSKFSMTNGVKH